MILFCFIKFFSFLFAKYKNLLRGRLKIISSSDSICVFGCFGYTGNEKLMISQTFDIHSCVTFHVCALVIINNDIILSVLLLLRWRVLLLLFLFYVPEHKCLSVCQSCARGNEKVTWYFMLACRVDIHVFNGKTNDMHPWLVDCWCILCVENHELLRNVKK